MRRLASLLALVAGCASAEVGDAGVAGDAAAPATVEVGTGRDRFEPLVEGQTVELVAGPQGTGRMMGFHVWGGVRVSGSPSRDLVVFFEILDAATREARATQTRVFALDPSGDVLDAYGIAPRIDDCCLAARRRLIMRAEVSDGATKLGADERGVVAGPCEGAGGARICP